MASIQFDEGPHPHSPLPIHHRKQLLVHVVDGLASIKPHAPYAYIPKSPNGYECGFQKLSYSKFANAVNGLAWWLTTQLGRSYSFDTVAYVGNNSFIHNALILACCKTGYQLLLASPRNQTEALTRLLKTVDCKALLTADPHSPLTARYQEAFPMPTFNVPSIDILLKEDFPHFPYSKTYEEAKRDPIVIFHTSGTTAFPKPLAYTNDWIAAYSQAMQCVPPDGMDLKDKYTRGVRLFVMMPPFHVANLFTIFLIPFFNETVAIYPPANLPLTVETFISGIQSTQVDMAFIPPYFLSQLATNESLLDITANHIESILTGGGKAVDCHGDIIASRLNCISTFGSTEIGVIPDLRPASQQAAVKTWSYLQPHATAGWEFREHGHTGWGAVHQAWVVRAQDPELEQPVFKLFPELHEFATRDLYLAHPTQPGLWKWCGRVDDTIVLTNAHNVNPMIMEEVVGEDANVAGVIMVGTARLRPSLIVEPRDMGMARDEMVDRIWAAVEKANVHYFEEHRILKSHILVATKDKPLSRSIKGTIQRNSTVDTYEGDLEDLDLITE